MSFRLYEGAWVQVAGRDAPAQARKDRSNLAAFNVAGHQYDIDARPLVPADGAPTLLSLLNLQAVREQGLNSGHGPDLDS